MAERIFPEETKHWEWFWFAYANEKIEHLANTHRKYTARASLVKQHEELHKKTRR